MSDLFFFKLINSLTPSDDIFDILQKYIYSSNYDNHNIPQYKFVTDENCKLLNKIKIFRQEKLDDIVKEYGFTNFNEKENKRRIGVRSYSFFLRDKRCLQLINLFYKKDFELFEYPMYYT